MIENCPTCAKPLPAVGFFCGACLTQFKCKSCGTILEPENAGCVNCGTPKESRNTSATSNPNHNTFKLHETATDRTIEATFSDTVGKDLAGILRDSYAMKQINKANGQITLLGNNGVAGQADQQFEELEVNNDEASETPSGNQNNGSKIPAGSYPTLKAIAMKNLPGSETEWVVVYAFYASEYGEETFTRQNILEKYEESNRSTTDRKKGLSANIRAVVRSGYINPLASDFALLDKGVEKAKEIITRTSSASPKPSKGRSSKNEKNADEKTTATKANKGKKSSGDHPKRLSNLDLAPSGKTSLENFYKQWPPKKNNENNLLFTYYLQEILKLDTITHDHIYTCYDGLKLIIPTSFRQSIINTVARTGWIQTKNGNLSVTTKGSNHLKTWKNDKK